MTSDSETAPGDTTTSEDEVKLAPAGDTSQSSETVVVPPTGGEDFDSQVETALTSLELDLKKIKNKATAKSAMSSLEKSVDSLEGLLKTSDSWGDVDRELIEFQLSDAEETFAKLKKTSFSKPKVKGVLKPLFERLEKLLENK